MAAEAFEGDLKMCGEKNKYIDPKQNPFLPCNIPEEKIFEDEENTDGQPLDDRIPVPIPQTNDEKKLNELMQKTGQFYVYGDDFYNGDFEAKLSAIPAFGLSKKDGKFMIERSGECKPLAEATTAEQALIDKAIAEVK
jgi:hypothetical protein